jgi:hypothetical protein
MRWAGYVALIETRNTYNFLVGNSEGMRPLGRSEHRWDGNIRTNLREVE